ELLFVRCESVDFPVADQHAGDQDEVIDGAPDPEQPALVAAAKDGIQPPVPLAELAPGASHERLLIPGRGHDRHARQDQSALSRLCWGEPADFVDADLQELPVVEVTSGDAPILNIQ